MFRQGMAGMLRRMFDGGVDYSAQRPDAIGGLSSNIMHLNDRFRIAAWCLGLAQIPVHLQFLLEHPAGKKIESDNPWDATTLEWQTPTPPPHGNFTKPLGRVSRPLRIQRARRRQGFHPAKRSPNQPPTRSFMEIPYKSTPARHRALQRQGRHLAVPGLGSHAVRRAVFLLHPPAGGRRSRANGPTAC